jgi:hypothetical protein
MFRSILRHLQQIIAEWIDVSWLYFESAWLGSLLVTLLVLWFITARLLPETKHSSFLSQYHLALFLSSSHVSHLSQARLSFGNPEANCFIVKFNTQLLTINLHTFNLFLMSMPLNRIALAAVLCQDWSYNTIKPPSPPWKHLKYKTILFTPADPFNIRRQSRVAAFVGLALAGETTPKLMSRILTAQLENMLIHAQIQYHNSNTLISDRCKAHLVRRAKLCLRHSVEANDPWHVAATLPSSQR